VGSGSANFNILQTVYLRLSEADANVQTVTQRTQEQLDSEEPVVIVDARGQEIVESRGTQGKFVNFDSFCYSMLSCITMQYDTNLNLKTDITNGQHLSNYR